MYAENGIHLAWTICKIGLVFANEMGYNQGVFSMCMMDEIRAKRDEIYAIARSRFRPGA